MKFQYLIFILFVVVLVTAKSTSKPGKTRYDNFKVYRIQAKNEQQLQLLMKLRAVVPVQHLNEVTTVGRSYDVVVHPKLQMALENYLKKFNYSYELTFDNLQSLLDLSEPKKFDGQLEWSEYHDLSDIYNWLDDMPRTEVIERFVVGYSYEKRPIRGIKISHKTGNKAIFIEANIHAIEWIASAATTCFANNLINSQDKKVQNIARNYDWIIVPVMNPDGFEYSHNVERLWRKNRRPTGYHNASGTCYGIDMNRNFNFEWKVSGHGINDPCDHWYAGAKPDTEVEVQALQRYINSLPDGYLRMYLAVHSYGNYLLLPYGHTNTQFPPNYKQMQNIAQGFANSAKSKYGTKYKYGASGLLNYPVSGSAKDWAYGVKKIPFTATIELRDSGKYGFFLPSEQIQEVCNELTDGFVGLIKAAESQKLFK